MIRCLGEIKGGNSPLEYLAPSESIGIIHVLETITEALARFR